MKNDKEIQSIVKEILLKEPKFQHSNLIYQFCWRYWEIVANQGKELTALSREGFIDLNVKYGTVESIIRARRKVLKEIDSKDISRYEMAQKHYLEYI